MMPLNHWCKITVNNEQSIIKNGFIQWIDDSDRHADFQKLDYADGTMVHLVTNNDFFWLGDCLIADFNERIDVAIERS